MNFYTSSYKNISGYFIEHDFHETRNTFDNVVWNAVTLMVAANIKDAIRGEIDDETTTTEVAEAKTKASTQESNVPHVQTNSVGSQ